MMDPKTRTLFIEVLKEGIAVYGIETAQQYSPSQIVDAMVQPEMRGIPADEYTRQQLLNNRKEAEQIVAGILGLM